MYSAAYSEICEETPELQRNEEREILSRVIENLKGLDHNDLKSREAQDAMRLTERLWLAFIDDLSSEANSFPDQLKADLLSIGLYIVGELEKIRAGQSQDIESIIAINEIIYKGLE